MDLKEQEILGEISENHWYYISKGRAMLKFLADIKVPEVLDVGAGTGIFTRQLLDANLCHSAVCVDPNYNEENIVEHNNKPIRFTRSVDSVPQKLILMMDVLEHVADDLELLESYTDKLEAGGHVFITVPAFQFLWSGHDVFLEHYRRYTIAMLEKVLLKAGMTPIKSRYFFGSLFPVAAAMRLIGKARRDQVRVKSELKSHSDWLNKVLTAVHDIERHTLFRFNKFFGLSVFCLCRKD